MVKLAYEPTAKAQWHALIEEAEAQCHAIDLDSELKAYLVILLQRFLRDPQLAASVLAMEYLKSQHAFGSEQKTMLRNLGDKCLLFSGLFPERAKKCNVSVVYYVEMGHTAYGTLSELHISQPETSQLFNELKNHFVKLMDLLHQIRSMREDQALDPFQAAELWATTGSQHARRILNQLKEDQH